MKLLACPRRSVEMSNLRLNSCIFNFINVLIASITSYKFLLAKIQAEIDKDDGSDPELYEHKRKLLEQCLHVVERSPNKEVSITFIWTSQAGLEFVGPKLELGFELERREVGPIL